MKLNEKGEAIGVACTSAEANGEPSPTSISGPNPRLVYNLPSWCWAGSRGLQGAG
jgi:hypothetical protein